MPSQIDEPQVVTEDNIAELPPLPHTTQAFPTGIDTDEQTAIDDKTEIATRMSDLQKKDKSIRDAKFFNTEKPAFIGDKWRAMAQTWDDTWLAKGYQDYKYSEQWDDVEDKEFISKWDDKAIMTTLTANKLNLTMYQRLAQAKNEEHKKQLVMWATKERDNNVFIDKTLNAYGGALTERTIASVATGLIDVDIPITLATGGAAKVFGIRKSMMAAAVGAHSASAAYIYNTANGELSASETALFGLIGSTADAFGVSRISKPKIKKDKSVDAVAEAPSNDELIDAGNKEKEFRQEAEAEVDIETPEYETTYTKRDEEIDTEHKSQYEKNQKAFDDGEIDQAEFFKRNEKNADKTQKKREENTVNRNKEKFGKPEPVHVDATIDEIHEYLLPREGSGSYTQYNIREEAKAARKYGKGSAGYKNRLKNIAYGRYQHMGATTRSIAKKTGKSVEWLRTPDGQEFAQKYLIEDNIKSMKHDGVPVTPANYYAYHQLGAGRAKRLFTGKLTNKDYKVLYAQLGRKAQKRVAGNPKLILEEWKKAYNKDGVPTQKGSYKKQVRQVDRDIDNANQRRRQTQRDATKTKKIDIELETLSKKKKALNEKIRKEEFDDLSNKRVQKDYRDMADDLAKNIVEYKATIKKAFEEGDTALIKDLDNIVTKLYDEGFIGKSEFDQYKSALKNKKFEAPKLNVTQNKDGTYSMNKTDKGKGGKKNKGKKIAVGSLLAIAATSEAMAGDGSDTYGNIMLGAFALLGGAAAFKNSKAIGQSAVRTGNKIKNLNRTRKLRTNVDELIGSLSTSLNETLSPLLKDKNKDFSDFVKKVLWDFENGDNLTVERNKAALFHGLSQALHRGNDVAYQSWLKETGVSRFSAALSNIVFNGVSKRMEFEIKVMEAIESGKQATSPAVMDAVKNTKDILDDLKAQMKASGVKGADEMFDIDNYMPRYFRSTEMNVHYRNLDVRNQKSFIDQFAKMFVGRDGDMAKAKVKAKEYFEMMTDVGESRQRFTNIKQIEEYIKDKGITSFTAEELAKDLGIASSQSGRTKTRIHINKSGFQTIVVKDMDGNTVKLELNDIFVNNSIEAVDRLLNSQTGHIALADAGFKSVDKAIEEAHKGAPDNAKVMEDIVNVLVGKPILDVSSKSAHMLENISNLTVAMKMPLSVISLTQEVFNTLVKSQGGIWQEMAREGVNVFKKHGESSALVDELMRFMGQGNHRQSASYGAFSHVANGVDNMNTATAGGFNKMSQIARDTVLYNLGLVSVSDFLARINMVDSASYLHDLAHGSKKISPQLRQAIGLTSKFEDTLKTKLIKKNGKLQKLDLDSWSRADQLEFKKLMDNMMQKRIQQATLGGTPHWGRSGTAGVIMTQLLKFPLQAFTNHGIYDLKGVLVHQDPRAMASMFAWFTGGYMASLLRSEVKGQDRTDDEHIMMAMLSMPLVGGFQGIYNSLTDAPAMLGAMGDVSSGMQGAFQTIKD